MAGIDAKIVAILLQKCKGQCKPLLNKNAQCAAQESSFDEKVALTKRYSYSHNLFLVFHSLERLVVNLHEMGAVLRISPVAAITLVYMCTVPG